MEFPPCHIGDFVPAIRGVSSRPYKEFIIDVLNGVAQLQFNMRLILSNKLVSYKKTFSHKNCILNYVNSLYGNLQPISLGQKDLIMTISPYYSFYPNIAWI